MSVITISRQLGSLGTEIARVVAKELNYEYVDKDKISETVVAYGLPAAEVEKFDEKRPPFWDSLSIQRARYLHSIQALIYDFARKDNVVIVGRGGQVLLKDLPGVLHVRIVAPFDFRIRRIIKQRGGDEKQAADVLHRSDRDSSGFIRAFFEVDWDDQTFYDLVINTRILSEETGARIILKTIHCPEIKEGEKGAEEKLSDLALTRKAEVSLLGILGTDFWQINIKAERGVVTLGGRVTSDVLRENCQSAVARMEGVNRVDNQLSVTRDWPSAQ